MECLFPLSETFGCRAADRRGNAVTVETANVAKHQIKCLIGFGKRYIQKTSARAKLYKNISCASLTRVSEQRLGLKGSINTKSQIQTQKKADSFGHQI